MTQPASMGGDTAADEVRSVTGKTVAPRTRRLSRAKGPLSREELVLVDRWWRAANYLAVGQIYLMANPLLREPLLPEHVKPRLLGHFGTVPGLNLVCAHAEPGHQGAGPRRGVRRRAGPRRPRPERVRLARGHLLRAWRATSLATPRAWPPSSVSSRSQAACPATARPRRRARSTRAASSATRSSTRSVLRSTSPTSSWPASSVTAKPRPAPWPRAGTAGASSTRPTTARCCRSCTSTSYKIANPTVLARIPEEELLELMRGYGYEPARRRRRRPRARPPGHGRRAGPQPRRHRRHPDPRLAAAGEPAGGRRWPMIVLRTPKGWTGPPVVDGHPVEGTFRAAPGAAAERPRGRRPPSRARGVAALVPARGAVRRRRSPGRRSCSTSSLTASDG